LVITGIDRLPPGFLRKGIQMCGIFGLVAKEEKDMGSILTEAGHRLSYRGYDSVGFGVFDNDDAIDLRKDVGKVSEVTERHRVKEMKGKRGMVQLRWATFGAPSATNAQPHLDSTGTMVGAHNGNIVNNVQLKAQFKAEGMKVRSTNDGESCVHAVEHYLKEGLPTAEAVREACQLLQGDYAFIVGRKGEEELYALKKGSGLVAGIGDGFTCVGSDLPCLLPLTREILRINDGEMVVLKNDTVEVRSVEDGKVVARDTEHVTESMDAAEKGGYDHFMLKEIHEQPKVAEDLIHLLGASKHVAPFVEKMMKARNLYLVGCGSSYNACLLGASYFARLAGRAAIPVIAPQFFPQYLPTINGEDVCLFVSQSGETKDVLDAMEVAAAKGAGTLALVNVLGSTLMNRSDMYLPLACGYELSVPATKTFLNTVVAFLFLAVRAGGGETGSLAVLPELISKTLEGLDEITAKVVARLKDKEDLYCLGYGLSYAVALEGALKLKEVTYAHCEGMLSTEFKHGPLSAVHDGFPVLFVVNPDNVDIMVSGINESSCRGALTIAVSEEDPRLALNATKVIALPPSGPVFSPILAVLPLQMIAYELGVARGQDPDFPRNLSKTLTVD